MKMKKAKKQKICKNCIVKRKGHTEEFDEKKVYASCYAACLSSSIPVIKAEKISSLISNQIKKWAIKRKSTTSDEIFQKVAGLLRKQDKNAAFMYQTHRDLS